MSKKVKLLLVGLGRNTFSTLGAKQKENKSNYGKGYI
jgi:hypothetical protein